MILSKYAFLNRFTVEETAAILAASDSVPAIRVYLFKLQVATDVDLSDQNTIAGVQQLELAGLIGVDRAAEILAIPRVRILAPFDTAWPDTYAVVSIEGSTYHTEVGDFDAMYVEVV